MASQDDFQEAIRDISKFSTLVGLEGQALLQCWVKRLQACASSGSAQGLARALDYAHYLTFQLQQRKQLGFPFSQPPAKGSLADLKEVLFGSDQEADAAVSVIDSSHRRRAKFPRPARHQTASLSLKNTTAHTEDVINNSEAQYVGSPDDYSKWDSHLYHRGMDEGSLWESHILDPKCERAIKAQLEELPTDAPVWLLLTKICSHTRDGGALLHAVIAEELAEWSALLAADQTIADKFSSTQEGKEEEWGLRAERRSGYWGNVRKVCKNLFSDDPKAGDLLTIKMKNWLNQQTCQLEAEQVQLKALIEELQGIQQHVLQTQKWKVSQFEEQKRILQMEVTSLRQSIADDTKKLRDLTHNWREPKPPAGNSTNTSKETSSFSQDILNNSSR